MNIFEKLPTIKLAPAGIFSKKFLDLGLSTFKDACHYVQDMDYGYNSDYEDKMILFKEKKGTCTSKHAVIASLAQELKISIYKFVGIYKFTEDICTGTQAILDQFQIPYIPMVHCFLVYKELHFDLSEGNKNGKKRPINKFIHTEPVDPFISRKDEYLLYKKVLQEKIMKFAEFQGISEKTLLKAREDAIKLLKNSII